MSLRTLIEINHDFAGQIDDDPLCFAALIARYLNSATREAAENLEHFGVHVIGMRHHSSNFILDGEPDGFPVSYLPKDTKHGK